MTFVLLRELSPLLPGVSRVKVLRLQANMVGNNQINILLPGIKEIVELDLSSTGVYLSIFISIYLSINQINILPPPQDIRYRNIICLSVYMFIQWASEYV